MFGNAYLSVLAMLSSKVFIQLWVAMRLMLMQYWISIPVLLFHNVFCENNRTCSTYFLSRECTTGFSNNLKKSILSKAKYIFDIKYVLGNLHVFNLQHVIDITHMCADVFDDFAVHIDEKYYRMATTDQAAAGAGNYDLDYERYYSYSEYDIELESDESEHEL